MSAAGGVNLMGKESCGSPLVVIEHRRNVKLWHSIFCSKSHNTSPVSPNTSCAMHGEHISYQRDPYPAWVATDDAIVLVFGHDCIGWTMRQWLLAVRFHLCSRLPWHLGSYKSGKYLAASGKWKVIILWLFPWCVTELVCMAKNWSSCAPTPCKGRENGGVLSLVLTVNVFVMSSNECDWWSCAVVQKEKKKEPLW